MDYYQVKDDLTMPATDEEEYRSGQTDHPLDQQMMMANNVPQSFVPSSSSANDPAFDPNFGLTRMLSLPKTTIAVHEDNPMISKHDLLNQFHKAVKHFKSSKLNLRARKTSMKLNHLPLSFEEEYSDTNKVKNNNNNHDSDDNSNINITGELEHYANNCPNNNNNGSVNSLVSSIHPLPQQQPIPIDLGNLSQQQQQLPVQTCQPNPLLPPPPTGIKGPEPDPRSSLFISRKRLPIPQIVHNEASKIVHLYIPILICLLFVLYSVATFEYYQAAIRGFAVTNFLPVDDIDVDDQDMLDRSSPAASEPTVNLENLKKVKEKISNKPWFIVGFILLIFGLVVLCSICILLLYRYECYNLIYAFFLMAFILYLGGFPLVYIQEMVFHYNWPTDWITLLFGLYNYVVVGILALFLAGPKFLRQFYHILICGILALFLIKLLNKWMEIGLLIVLICWDCYAVLHQKGPLNNLLDTVEQKGQALPPIVFQMTVWLQVDRGNNNSSSKNKQNQNRTSTNETVAGQSRVSVVGKQPSKKGSNTSNRSESGGESDYEIGLGDFIFFSFLVGKAHLYAGLIGSIFTMLAVITGLTLTLFLLLICERPLPALPIPISFGLITQLCAEYFIVPMADSMNSKLIVL